jgi:hypothetical protein
LGAAMFKINSILCFSLILLTGCNVKLGNSGKNPNSSSSSNNSSPTPSPTAPPPLTPPGPLDCATIALINCDSTAGCKSYDNKCYAQNEVLSKQAAKDKITEITQALSDADTKVTKVVSTVDKTDVDNAIVNLKNSQTDLQQAIAKTKAVIDSSNKRCRC